MMKRDTVSDAERAAEDRRLSEAIGAGFAPAPMSAARGAAFGRALGDRLRRRDRLWKPAISIGATAVAGAVLWLALLPSAPPGLRITDPDASDAPALYAFVDPDFDDGDRQRAADFLPDDYLALAGAFDLPLDDL